jgi:hypothetical protein
LAVNPANAMLNYLYALLESEARLAAAAVGLDPGLGFLHMDTEHRDSLACDLMEPVRPQVDEFVLDWLSREPLSRRWFFEQRNGNCRLMADIAARLSETASAWRHAVAPFAEWTADTLWASIKSADRKQPRPTPLTQRHKREAKGVPPAVVRPPRPQTVCRICGTPVPSKKNYCKACAGNLARERMIEIAKAGRVESQKAAARAQLAESQRRNEAAKQLWDASSLPAWLTKQRYVEQIMPRLAGLKVQHIRMALTVSVLYASKVRRGLTVPHPRHWAKLAEMVGYAVGK